MSALAKLMCHFDEVKSYHRYNHALIAVVEPKSACDDASIVIKEDNAQLQVHGIDDNGKV